MVHDTNLKKLWSLGTVIVLPEKIDYGGKHAEVKL